VEENARKKLHAKCADMVVGNLVGPGKGFGTDENEVLFVTDDASRPLPTMSKRDLADAILDCAMGLLQDR
jgi:phosphopantothenoylcysteine decarboxylase/phosphopantothenate--cysteine ligase